MRYYVGFQVIARKTASNHQVLPTVRSVFVIRFFLVAFVTLIVTFGVFRFGRSLNDFPAPIADDSTLTVIEFEHCRYVI